MIAIFISIFATWLIYKIALRKRVVRLRHLCACGCGVEIKVGRTLATAACRKRMQRRRDRIKRGLPPTKPEKLPLLPKLKYSTKQENLL